MNTTLANTPASALMVVPESSDYAKTIKTEFEAEPGNKI